MTRLTATTALCLASLVQAQTVVRWDVETQAIPSTQAGDVAIVGTHGGLVVGVDTAQIGGYAYTPATGQLAKIIPIGPLKSADARGPFLFLTTANNGLFAYFDDADAGLVQLEPLSFSILSAGFVALRDKGNSDFTLHVTRTASVERWDLHVEDGGVQFTSIDQVTLPQVPNGVAVDDRNGNLFITVPRGVLLLPAPGGGSNTAAFIASTDAGQLGPQPGGVALLPLRDGGVWVLTTNATGPTVVVHELNQVNTTLDFIGAVAIGAPDGGAARAALPLHVDATLASLPGFPRGLVAVHDGVSANYKLVSLQGFDDAFPIPPLTNEDDGGVEDAGSTDAGATDGGQSDGGRDGGTGGASGGFGGNGGNGIGPDPMPAGCSCGDPLLVFLPVMLGVWWIRRLRFSRP